MTFRTAALLAVGLLTTAASDAPWRWPEGRLSPAVPAENPMTQAKADLGRRLFYDADLSIDGTMACATCHQQKHGFTDGNRTHPGVHGDPGRRNVPGLANVAWRRSLTWGDPQVRTLEAQAAIPLLGDDPVEMGMQGAEDELARRLGRDACYRRMFAQAFPEKNGRIDMGTVTAALAAFQRRLVSTNSAYDRWRRGDRSAMTLSAIEGERLFARKCASCHSGEDLTDDGFHRVAAGLSDTVDKGIGESTGDPSDFGKFRTPSLRNAAVTGPYFHDGASSTLREAIGRHRDLKLADGEAGLLISFLEALTDDAFLQEASFTYPDNICGRAF
ncbi:MAG: cytochrome c peroxidase [Novosphingobium sp.]